MKTSLALLLITPILAYGQAREWEALRDADLKKYSLERGEIKYEITGGATGQEVMMFDRFGWQSMRRQTMIFELYGIKTIQTLYEVINGDFINRLNEGDSTYVVRKDLKWSQQAAYKDPEQASEAILFSLGGTHAADSVLMDRECQVWTFEGKALQQLWIWKGLVLKRKTKLGDQIIYSTANSINLETEIDPEIFTIPPYMNLKE